MFGKNIQITDVLLETGIVILLGFLCGELAKKIKFPKVSGYIFAGIILNPDIFGIISTDFIDNSGSLIHIALAFITFSVGGSLFYENIRKSGKVILTLTAMEAFFAFLLVAITSFVALHFVFGLFDSWQLDLACALVLGALAAPTDPSATLAVEAEYHAKGPVSSTVLEVAAFDDIFGIVFYTLCVAAAVVFTSDVPISTGNILWSLGSSIGGGIGIGIGAGWLFNKSTDIFNKETEGELIVLISGFLMATYGVATMLHVDELLTTMTLGAVIVNFNSQRERIFNIIERYTDELIFVLFFTLSGLHLQFESISGNLPIIAIFILARFAGKFLGIFTGSILAGAPAVVRKYAAGGLIPQGGIVIGLALLLTKNNAFHEIANAIIGIVIGATVVHEIIGPMISKYFLKKSGDISPES